KTSSYGLEISANYKPLEWWNINGSFDLFTQTQRGLSEYFDPTVPDPGVEDILTESVEVDNTAWNLRMNNSFTVNKKLSLQAFGFYRGKFRSIQFESDPMYFVNVGARYSFDQGRGTLSLNYNDIFRTMKASFESDYPYAMLGEFRWESNRIYVGASYRFGSGKNRVKQRKQRDSNIKQDAGGILQRQVEGARRSVGWLVLPRAQTKNPDLLGGRGFVISRFGDHQRIMALAQV